jgi:uncharacterized Zn finger protein
VSGRTRFGLTWWGQRWIGALEALGAVYANRLPRGRTYARKGTVQDLTVGAGTVTARVQGSRARPYRVQLQLPVFDEVTWEQITAALASRVRLSAELLAATMPEDIDGVLAECGVSLFPTARELTTRCSCPDVANPCKHVAAVHYVLAQTFDADPFLLTTLRGRDRDVLLAGLRARRAGTAVPERPVETTDDPVPVDALRARELYRATGSLADIAVRPHAPDDPGAVLRRLGPAPGLEAATDDLQGAVADAAAIAWELLDRDADPVMAALRQHGATSARQLAELLDEPIETIRATLQRLRHEGALSTTGRGPSTRYHPAR